MIARPESQDPQQAPAPPRPATVRLPEAPLLVAGLRNAVWLSSDGEVSEPSPSEAARLGQATPPILCHAKATSRRLGCDPFPAYDLLELFAFVRPAGFCTPTPRGLAIALGLPGASTLEAQAAALHEAMRRLLAELAAGSGRKDPDAPAVAWAMAQAGWRWGPVVIAALGGDGASQGDPAEGDRRGGRKVGLRVWERLPSWSETGDEAEPGNAPVDTGAARRRLAELLGDESEPRPQQADYASAVSGAFVPRIRPDEPTLVLAEAGTGVGKTLGYIAPASLWAETNGGAVWLSTYTRNLQHQIDRELDRLYPSPADQRDRVVIRKGRENYLCLLNLEEAVSGLPMRPYDAVATGLMVRWAGRSRDGDMVGGDFPAWLADLLGRPATMGLTDRRGECIHSACAHYGKCFIERTVRRARKADLVIANHALVMIQAALGAGEEGGLPAHYVFDEGHHVFDAADGAFAAHLSGQECAELRRWLVGGESGSRSATRVRGLKRRLEDLVAGDEDCEAALEEVLRAARALPGEGWHQRLAEGRQSGPIEQFLSLVRQQVYARSRHPDSPYGLEVETKPLVPELEAQLPAVEAALARLAAPLARLERGLAKRLEADAEELESDTRRRIEAVCRGLRRRGSQQIGTWRAMLTALLEDRPPEFVDWFAVERGDGRDLDIGLYRHWVDPSRPFADVVMRPAQGLVITSATLTDGAGGDEAAWAAAEMRSGAVHLPNAPVRARVPSPFDYAAKTKVLVVNDVRKDDLGQVAGAYRALFQASGGGALGLFTAISRLRAVHARIAGPLEETGLTLYAQHVDRLDTATLIDVFRAELDSCLLGTDAVRDGVDVPGRALRLIVFDRVPWPRPDIRHRARREAFGGRAYDDRLTRLRLKQAYGRLIRQAGDRGVFVLLDPMMPTRLTDAYPEGVEVVRLGLRDAVAAVTGFLATEIELKG